MWERGTCAAREGPTCEKCWLRVLATVTCVSWPSTCKIIVLLLCFLPKIKLIVLCYCLGWYLSIYFLNIVSLPH